MTDEIIAKYRHIAGLPDWLFAFTFPLRRRAINKLMLKPGDRVLDVGCGSGPNFSLLVEAVGPSGQVIGFDLSPDMVHAANARIEKHTWGNIIAFEASAENVELPGMYDGLVLFAMHDVFTSLSGLSNVLDYLRPGGRIVTVGPKLAEAGIGRAFNPMIRKLFRRMAVSDQDLDCPWRLLQTLTPALETEFFLSGLLFLAWGVKQDI